MEPINETVKQFQAAMIQNCQSKCDGSSPEPGDLRDIWLGFVPWCPQLVDAHRRVARFVNKTGPLALVLSGGRGVGKTHLARVVANFVQLRCIMVAECDLIARIQSGYSGNGESEETIIGRLRRAEFLVIDDLGTAHVRAESQTWIEGIYWRILDRRYERRLPTMVTTNLDLRQIGARIGDRAMSRLMGMMESMGTGYVDLSDVGDWRLRGWADASEGAL